MRKFIFTLMLAAVSSVWMMSSALCIARAPQAVQPSTETLSGLLVMAGTPCESTDTLNPCLPCLTLAFQSNESLYYLTSDNDQMMSQLDEIEAQILETMPATVTGIVYQQGSYHYINVQSISLNNDPLPSLCDEWNVLAHLMAWGPEYESFSTHHYRLTHDTIINNTSYVALEKEGQYVGAMREENNARIYYYPANATHEYLLYAFDAKVGDSFENVWFGGSPQQFPNGSRATVREIQETTPRVMWLGVEYSLEGIDEIHTCTHYYWIDGVGLFVGPCGEDCPFDCGGGPALSVLCAYKNGEQVYAAPLSKELGCEYNYTPNKTPTDTIPLYTQDDPGSSTVDPVDPNQVVVTLQGDQLTIHESSGVDVTYSLNNESVNQLPAQNRAPKAQTFRNEVTIQITESGQYLLQLTNPSWGYTIFGRFNYVAESTEHIHPESAPHKMLKDGQIYIIRDSKTYTVMGQEIK